MENIYIFNYNNYYNRIFKRNIPQEISDYPEELYCEAVSNFNPNDGITAEAIINYSGNLNPDYCVVTDEDYEILSRWFVMEVVRTRAHQYRMVLKRDVIADNFDAIKNGTAFIEKSILNLNNTDQFPLLYNQENISTNQILVGRGMITDKTSNPWIIMYLDPRPLKNDGTEDMNGMINTINSAQTQTYSYITDISYSDISSFMSPIKLIGTQSGNDYTAININSVKVKTQGNKYYSSTIGTRCDNTGEILCETYGPDSESTDNLEWQIVNNTGVTESADTISTFLRKKFTDLRSTSFWSNLLSLRFSITNNYYINIFNAYNNKIVSRVIDENTLYYRTRFVIDSISYEDIEVKNNGDTQSCYQILQTQLAAIENPPSNIREFLSNNNGSKAYISVPYVECHIVLDNLPGNSISIDNTDGHKFTALQKVNDNAFIMLALEYSQPNLEYMTYLQTRLGNYCFDTQVLPFFPGQNLITDYGTIDVSTLSEGVDYALVRVMNEGTLVYSRPLVVCKESIFDVTNNEFSPDVNLYNYAKNHYYPKMADPLLTYKSLAYRKLMIDDEVNPILKKANYLTRKFRLCAPNGSAYFDFTKEMNGNNVINCNINCVYKPINPYIRISPKFANFYGPIQNDYRGIIFNGDFSIARINSAWVTYENQNKNYENIFNREVKNIEINQNVQREQERWSIGTGAFTAGITGATSGFLMSGGNVAGAVAGGLASSGASLLGGLRDYQLNEKLRAETLDYKNDLFGFNIGNIKAAPNTISKTGVLSNNNPLFPYIEVYACSEGEYNAVVNKLIYNSMSVQTIGKINDFIIQSSIVFPKNIDSSTMSYITLDKMYFKCKLINSNIADDTHLVQEVADELDKGVFIQWE